jgi:hypothetical protein
MYYVGYVLTFSAANLRQLKNTVGLVAEAAGETWLSLRLGAKLSRWANGWSGVLAKLRRMRSSAVIS